MCHCIGEGDVICVPNINVTAKRVSDKLPRAGAIQLGRHWLYPGHRVQNHLHQTLCARGKAQRVGVGATARWDEMCVLGMVKAHVSCRKPGASQPRPKASLHARSPKMFIPRPKPLSPHSRTPCTMCDTRNLHTNRAGSAQLRLGACSTLVALEASIILGGGIQNKTIPAPASQKDMLALQG